jgi:hypothetical protein
MAGSVSLAFVDRREDDNLSAGIPFPASVAATYFLGPIKRSSGFVRGRFTRRKSEDFFYVSNDERVRLLATRNSAATAHADAERRARC